MPSDSDSQIEIAISAETPEKKSSLYIFYSAVFMLYAIFSWALLGYNNLSGIIAVWGLILLGFIYLAYSVSLGKKNAVVEKLPYLSLALSIYLFVLISASLYPSAVNDEMVIDTYAAYLFVHGLDPYVPSNMVNVFAYFNFPTSLGTPLRSGGFVYYLIYPAFSVYAMIPTIYFGLPDYTVPLIFNLLTLFLLFWYYRKNGFGRTVPMLVLIIFLEVELISASLYGTTDIIWVFFLALAFIFRKRPWMAGLMMGISISQKQIPVLIFPFLLYMILRENGGNLKAPIRSLIMAGVVFIALNSPFIFMNPLAWFSSMILSAGQPIIGVGFGFGVLSFAGYSAIPAAVYSDLLIAALAFTFVVYIRYYRAMKYSFFAFPIIIFLFNFRSLENYVIFWPLLTALVLPDFIKEKKSNISLTDTEVRNKTFLNGSSALLKKSNFTVFLMLVVVLGGFFSAGYSYHTNSQYQSEITINNITGFSNPAMAPSEVTGMTVNISYNPSENSKATVPVYFRLLPSAPIQSNINALLWTSPSPYLHPGNNSLKIYPDSYSDFLHQNLSFTLESYYGNATSFLHSRSPVLINPPISDPTLLYPTKERQNPYPGWHSVSTTGHGEISTQSGSVSMTSGKIYSGFNETGIYTDLNFTYLAANNYSLSYSISSKNGTSFARNGSMVTFAGILLSFNSGQEKYWIGYNSTLNNPIRDSANLYNQTLTQSSGNLNFAGIYSYLYSQGWGFNRAQISMLVVSSTNITVGSSFSNITLYENGSSSIPLSQGPGPGANMVWAGENTQFQLEISRLPCIKPEVVCW